MPISKTIYIVDLRNFWDDRQTDGHTFCDYSSGNTRELKITFFDVLISQLSSKYVIRGIWITRFVTSTVKPQDFHAAKSSCNNFSVLSYFFTFTSLQN